MKELNRPTLVELKKYFKNAKRVESLYGFIFKIDNTVLNSIHEEIGSYWFRDLEGHSRKIWDSKEGYAEILEPRVELVGYKLVKKDYYKAVVSIEGNLTIGNAIKGQQLLTKPEAIQKFVDAGVLDLWFEPVYEDLVKLPKINGYKGIDEGKVLAYGCAKIPKSWFKELEGNRLISSITLSNGVKFSENNVSLIRDYIENNS